MGENAHLGNLVKVGPVRLRDLVIDPPLFQAPLLDYTNHFFRLLLRHFGGVGLTCTELVHARGLVEMYERHNQWPEQLWGVREEPRPVAVQLWDNDPQWLGRAVSLVVAELSPSAIDLNFGCPSYRVSQQSAGGAALLREPERIGVLVEAAVAAAGGTPVTVKTRLGWDPSHPLAERVAEIVEEAGAAGIAIHGRFASQRMGGRADWEAISRVKNHLKRIPLIGNGDITGAEQAVAAFERWGVDGVMIGRAAVARPWIFRDIQALLRGEAVLPPPSPKKQLEIVLAHVDRLAEVLAPHRALVLAQKFCCKFVQGRPGARYLRLAISQARSLGELRKLLESAFVDAGEANL